MQRFDLKRFRIDRELTQKELAELLMCKQNYISNIENGIKPISKEKLDILQSKFGDISKYYSDISPKQNTVLKEVTPEDFMFAGADAFSRQVVKMMNDKLIAPYGMLVEKDKEIERLNRLIGRLQNEIVPKRGILPNVPMPYSVWFKAKEILIWKSIIEWL